MNDKQSYPPSWADKMLSFFCRPDYADEILGDLHEAFHWRAESNIRKAKVKFVWEVLRSLRPKNLKSFYHFSLNTMIFRNYIKVALRSFMKRKSTSFINILGLSLGAASFLIIFLYAFQVLTFDDHHENKDRIFLAFKERVTPTGIQPAYDTWVPMANRLKSDYSQVEAATRFYQTEIKAIKGNTYLEEELTYVDESFFKIFSYPLLHGNEHRVFQDLSSMVISADLALKYFQTEDAIGETLRIFIPEEDTTVNFQISAVLDRYPENISLQPSIIIQPESVHYFTQASNYWGGSFLETFVLLDHPDSQAELEASFPDLVESIWDSETRSNTNFRLLPFDGYYDEFVGNKSNARTLLMIGLGILLIASINFMNLATAQASQRTKEIGLRKVLGAFQSQLRSQFVTEAFVASFIATVLGIAIAFLIIPIFNDFFELSISVTSFSIFEIVIFSLGMSLALGLLSGSYPAFYLSSISALDSLRQKMGLGGSVMFRNTLVVIQFTIALFLIASSIFIRNQIQYMSSKKMGFESEGILILTASRNDFEDREGGMEKLNTFKNELKSKSYIKDVALSRAVPTEWTRSFTFVKPSGWEGDPSRMRYTFVNTNFFELYDIKVKYGSSFLPDEVGGDQRSSVILNEAAMKDFSFSPNEQNAIQIGDRTLNVVGVVEDFNFESLQNEVAPTLIFHRQASNPTHRYISCKMDMTDLPNRLIEIEELWEGLGSTEAFEYSFMDDNVANLYEEEERYLGLVSLFSTLAIIVACLGLYGLTLFIIEKRRKEISIRKVLGAEISRIIRLIFKDFTKWVVIAFALSVPFVIFFVSDWLEAYYYRIHISWLTFLFTLVVVLGLVILTVGYQSLRAATSNPVSYLKDE